MNSTSLLGRRALDAFAQIELHALSLLRWRRGDDIDVWSLLAICCAIAEEPASISPIAINPETRMSSSRLLFAAV